MRKSKFDRVAIFVAKVWLVLCIIFLILNFIIPISTIFYVLVYFIVIAPIIETLIFQYPWIRFFPKTKNDRDIVVWISSIVFGIVHFLDRLFGGELLTQFFKINPDRIIYIAIGSGLITFFIGLWLARGCRLYISEKRYLDAFFVTVGRHGIWNASVFILSIVLAIFFTLLINN